MTVVPDPDLMAADPESMYAAAAACESAAHLVHSVGAATGRASAELLAEWKGQGADAFAARVKHLATATPEQAQGLIAAATALRTLAPQISEAQGLARRATTLREQAAITLDAVHHSNLAAVRAQAAADDAITADTMTAQANALAAQAWQAATVALDSISATSPSVKTAMLTSAIKTEPARQPHDHAPKVSPDQVKILTQPDGRRVYSFDGGLAIPVDLPGAHRFVEEINAYMPRFLAGDHGGIHVPAHLSARAMWFEAAYIFVMASQAEIPRELRNLFSTDTSSSITFRQVAGFSMLGATEDAVAPTPVKAELGKSSDFLNNGDIPPEQVADKQIAQTNQGLGTETGRALAREQGSVDRLLYGARPGDGLPGSAGVAIDGRPSVSELENLTMKHGVEFSVTYKLGEGPNGAGGQYFLYSGDANSCQVPISSDQMFIYHTHPMGTASASEADRNVLELLHAAGSPQRISYVIPVGKGRAIPFGGAP